MEYFPAPLEKLVEQFARLPGIGGKSAQRLAFYVLGLPEAEILSFDGGKIRPVRYEETSSYQITRRFMADREAWLRQLLAESEE